MSNASAARRRGSAIAVAMALVALLALTGVGAGTAVAATGPGRTELLSLTPGGDDKTAEPTNVVLSADGRYAAFDAASSSSTVPNSRDVYVRDRRNGTTTLITDVVRFPQGAVTGRLTLSADGRYVAFAATVTGGSGGFTFTYQPIAVCDRDPDNDNVFDEPIANAGPASGCVLVGLTPQNSEGDAGNSDPSLSADGTVLAWTVTRGGGQTSALTARLTRQTGVLTEPGRSGYIQLDPPSGGDTGPPRVSGDGRHVLVPAIVPPRILSRGLPDGSTPMVQPVAYTAPASPTPGRAQPFGGSAELYDFELSAPAAPPTGDVDSGPPDEAVPRQLYRTDLTSTPDRNLLDVAVSADGRFVAYTASAPDGGLTVLDRDPNTDTRLWPASEEQVTPTPIDVGGYEPTLSDDGRYLSYVTDSRGVHDGGDREIVNDSDVNSVIAQVARRDLGQPLTNRAELVSVGSTPCTGASFCGGGMPSGRPAISRDGAVVAFSSSAADLTNDERPGGAIYARIGQPVVLPPADFGGVPTGGSAVRDVVVRNDGSGPMRIDSAVLIGDDATQFRTAVPDGCTGVTIGPAGTCVVRVTFQPVGVAGPRVAAMRVASQGRFQDVPLTGTAADAPVSPTPTTGQPTPTVPQPTPTPGQPTPTVIQPTPTGSQPTPTVIQTTPTVPQPTPTVIQPTPTVAQPTPPVLQPDPGPVLAAPPAGVGPTQPPGGAAPVPGPGAAAAPPNPVVPPVPVVPPPVPAAGGTPAVAPIAATVVLEPAVVQPGRVVVVRGFGFPPVTPVTVTIVGPGGSTPVVTGADAAGRVAVSVPVLEHSTLGTAQVTVTAAPLTVASGSLLIVPGTYQPRIVGRR